MAQFMTEYGEIIFYNQVMDKSAMRLLIGRLITYLGSECTTRILDQLKTLGFRHATQAGISLGIDDLLTTPSKTWLIKDAEHQVHTSEEQYQRGSVHAVEKLRHIVETWHTTSEYLKREMNYHFKRTDPLNPVHMMSFSGARGNVSQVHQLVGMRGLMSNPQGNIIDLPIQSNFREGLSLIEYIISCYGARKGVVDTAVRTADAGYLTRRLVEVVQHVVVSNVDCKTNDGIYLRPIRDGKTSFSLLSLQDRLIGRVLARPIYVGSRCIALKNQDVAPDLANRLADLEEKIYVRSPLTCKSMSRVCQMCYGWDLSCGNLVELGTAIGIIAGQSIGEPGTQLTLRTFHTGGVFTGDVAEHLRAPFSGIISFDTKKIQPTRNRHGRPSWICPEVFTITLQDSSDKKKVLHVPQYSLLLVRNYQYVQSRQVLAEVRASIAPLKEKIEKDIYSSSQGEIFYKNISLRSLSSKYKNLFSFVSPQNRLNLWFEFASLRSHISSFVEQTSHIWVFTGHLKQFPANFLNISLFYRVQDYIQCDLPIGKENNVFNQYTTLESKFESKPQLTWNNTRNSKRLFSESSGSIYRQDQQNTWILILSSFDQFQIPLREAQIKKQKEVLTQENQLIFSSAKDSYIGFLGEINNYFSKSSIQNFVFLLILSESSDFLNQKSQKLAKKNISSTFFLNYNHLKRQYSWIDFTYKILCFQSKIFFQILTNIQKNILGQSVCKNVTNSLCGKISESGQILSLSESFLSIRLAKLYLIPAGNTIHVSHKQIITEGDTLITFMYERLKASDIIQGLPKVEQLLEARLENKVVINLHMRFKYLVEHFQTQLRQYLSSLTQMDLILSFLSINRAIKALEYNQIETVDQVQKVYLSQGVYLSDKHVEIIVCQISCKVLLVQNTDLTAISPKTVIRTAFPYDNIGVYFPGELVHISRAQRINRILQKGLSWKPILLGITKASLNTDSFLSEASFERTITVLSRSALQGRLDWLKGLKENVLLSNLIPAGTGFKEIGLKVVFYRNQQKFLKVKRNHIFHNLSQSTFSLLRPSFPKRDWLHKQLQQIAPAPINSRLKTKFFLQNSKKIDSSFLKKGREIYYSK